MKICFLYFDIWNLANAQFGRWHRVVLGIWNLEFFKPLSQKESQSIMFSETQKVRFNLPPDFWI